MVSEVHCLLVIGSAGSGGHPILPAMNWRMSWRAVQTSEPRIEAAADRQGGPAQMPIILFENDTDFRLCLAFVDAMMRRGIYLHPFHNVFICAAMTADDILLTLNSVEEDFVDMARRSEFDPPPSDVTEMMSRRRRSAS